MPALIDRRVSLAKRVPTVTKSVIGATSRWDAVAVLAHFDPTHRMPAMSLDQFAKTCRALLQPIVTKMVQAILANWVEDGRVAAV